MNPISSKIIVIQSNSTITSLFGDGLKKKGHDLKVIERGDTVLDNLRNDPLPDLFLVDSNLKSPDALQVCRKVKADPDLGLIPLLVVETIQNGTQPDDFALADCDDILTYPVSPISFYFRVEALVRLRQSTLHLDDSESILYTLGRTLEAKDRYTMGHMDRVAHFAVQCGKALGITGWDLEVLRKGALLHDVGKIAIPDAILMKPGRYTPEEFAIMKKHPVLGCQICEKLRSIKDALPLIRHHHERLDGSGYPDRLAGDQVPPLVRIVSIVDIYDALRSRRVYKEAFDLDKSFQIMWEEVEKGWWDREVLTCWEKIVRSNRVGTPPPVK